MALLLTADYHHTPKKRKADVLFESPSVKRIHGQSSSGPSATSPLPRSPLSSERSSEKLPNFKRKQVFVELPPVSKALQRAPVTPKREHPLSQSTSRRGVESDSDDLGGYGSETPSRSRMFEHVKSSGRRATGDRDERGINYNTPSHVSTNNMSIAPLDKLTTLLEDIFEAEDSIAPDLEVSDLSAEFFSPHTTDTSRPLLHPHVVRKLTSQIGKAARPSKRLRLSARDGNVNGAGTPRSKGRIADVGTNMLTRTLRLLNRSAKVGEDLDPFQADRVGPAPPEPATPSKKKGKQKAADQNRSKSKTPKPGEGDADGDVAMNDDTQSDGQTFDAHTISHTLEVAKDSVLAADCCIALLSSDRLNKQVILLSIYERGGSDFTHTSLAFY